MSEPDDAQAKERTEIGGRVAWEDALGCEIDLPPWRFQSFEMPDGQRFIALFFGQHLAEIELVERGQMSAAAGERGRATDPHAYPTAVTRQNADVNRT